PRLCSDHPPPHSFPTRRSSDLHPQKIQELQARREDVLMVMKELRRQLSVRETLQRQAPAPTTLRRSPPPLPGRATGKFPAQPSVSPSDSRTVRRLEVQRVQEVTSEVREQAQRTTQTFHVASTTRTPTPQPSAPAAKP